MHELLRRPGPASPAASAGACTFASSGSAFSPAASGAGEDVGRGDRVLDGEIDADAADRRHGVGGVADARAGPGRDQWSSRSSETVSNLTWSQLSSVPVDVGEIGDGAGDVVAEGVDARAPPAPSAAPFGTTIGALPIIAAVDHGR